MLEELMLSQGQVRIWVEILRKWKLTEVGRSRCKKKIKIINAKIEIYYR